MKLEKVKRGQLDLPGLSYQIAEHDRENHMNEITHNQAPAPTDSLHAELRALIASSRQRLAGPVNGELTRLYWNVGKRLRTEVLEEGRASWKPSSWSGAGALRL